MKSKMKTALVLILTIVSVTGAFATGEAESDDASAYRIAVYVPGVLAGSPTYEQMDRGARAAAEATGSSVTTVEAGFNQGEWKDKLMALASEGSYNLIVTSNPAMTEICSQVKELFPAQLFLVMDGTDQDSENLIVYSYNHKEQGFMAGYLAAQIALSEMKNLSGEKKIGLIAGQTYPDMEKSIVPGVIMGMKSVDPAFELDFRVVGNWYDASKGAELADSMYRNGVDVILPIAGGANQGVLSAAKKSDKYLVWFDSAGTEQAEGTILGSAIILQEKAVEESVLEIIGGTLKEGDLRRGDIANGYILLDQSEKGYLDRVPADVQEKVVNQMEQFISGRYSLNS